MSEYIKKEDMEKILYSTNNAVRIGELFTELPTYSFPDSAENKGDLISRQVVLDELEKWDWQELYLPIHFKQILDDVPSVENKVGWIPVSERLPEEREWYLAVFREKDTDFQLIPRVADYIGQGENKWRWIDEEGTPQEYFDLLECVAWQPLPEPYKAEKGGE